MFKAVLFLFIFASTFICSAEFFEYFSVDPQRDGTVEVNMNVDIDKFSYAELYKSEKGGNFVPIFEFSSRESSFTDNFALDSCYQLTVYFLNGSSVMTDKKCLAGAKYFGMIDTTFLMFFLIFLVSLFFPFFIKNKIFFEKSPDLKIILDRIKSLLGEEGRDVVFYTSDYSMGNPLKESLKMMTQFFSFYCDPDRDLIMAVPFYEKYSGEKPGGNAAFSNDMTPSAEISCHTLFFGTDNGSSPSVVFNFTSGSAETEFFELQDSSEKGRRFFASVTVSGSVANVLMERSGLLSMESFLIPCDLNVEKEETDCSSGAYIFLLIICLIIFLGSLFYTFDFVFPFLSNLLSFITARG